MGRRMDMGMKVVLDVDKGPNTGERYDLPAHGYRAVCRAGEQDVTAQFTVDGDHPLEPDDLRLLEDHLKRREKTESEPSGGLRIGLLKRGRDILLDDDKISRTHAMFFLDDNGPSVVDLMSTNGTLVNGAAVSDADLYDGDIVHIGRTRLIVRVAPIS